MQLNMLNDLAEAMKALDGKKRTRPVRAVYNPDGKHTYVGLGVRSSAYANNISSSNGRFCTGSQLWPAVAVWYKSRKECLSFCSQSRLDALTRISRYRTFCD